MLRQKDNPIFDTRKLQAIVLDEAHLYTGTLGNDINMLLRRVINRFNPEKPVRFYATSATIGDNSDNKSSTVFASKSTIFSILDYVASMGTTALPTA